PSRGVPAGSARRRQVRSSSAALVVWSRGSGLVGVPGGGHGGCVGGGLWGGYDRVGLRILQHAADSADDAHYERPAMLAGPGAVAGRRVLDAACGPGLYLRELLERGPRSPVLTRARSWWAWPGSRPRAGRGSTRRCWENR